MWRFYFQACWVVHAVGEISFRDENNLAQAVNFSRLCLTEDKELPVKIEAGIALQFLIENQDQGICTCSRGYSGTVWVEA